MRNSPSGSGTFTDLRGAFFQFDDDDAPGKYIIFPEENFFSDTVGPLPPIDPLVGFPQQSTIAAANGIQTRRGKIGRARAIYGVDSSGGATARRKPTTLQWAVYDGKTGDIALVGKKVTLPWAPLIAAPTSLTQLPNEALDFGSAPWGVGGGYALIVDLGVKIDPGVSGDLNVLLNFETVYEPLSPVPGPEGT